MTGSTWERRLVARALVEHPPSVVVIVAPRAGFSEELRGPEITRLVWARHLPRERIGGYLVLDPATPAEIASAAPALEPRFGSIAAVPRSLGHVPEVWGREGLEAEVGAGPGLGAFPGAISTGPLAGWSGERIGDQVLLHGPPILADSVGFVRVFLSGSGSAAIGFTTDRARTFDAVRSFPFEASGPRTVALVPVSAFAAWH